ncbi:hypothetical protein [Bosea sp. UNC402CLCol]|jgi:hypothetical protein|uniref:hypothetical protein n=1 Tax=Bosea sp. UNC402CLCol TaxID=1510531 RepID=UPI0010F30819|nr:hypothetical protein [Bosea sp. UNC402CLCol]
MAALQAGRILLPLIVALAPFALVLAPRDNASVIVFAADGRAAAAAIAHAGGTVLARFSSFGFVARAESPGFAMRLYLAGALLVLDGAGRGGCLASTGRS